MTPVKPLLLVDVDGVLNCFGSIWTPAYEEEHFYPPRMAFSMYSIRVRKGTDERLRRLAQHFEMTWATAWCEQAHPFFGEWLELGDPWPHLAWKAGIVGEGQTWKLADVKEFAARNLGRPLAWIDDDLQGDAFEWANERVEQGTPTLLVKTDPCQGIGDEEESRLLAFAGASEAILSNGQRRASA